LARGAGRPAGRRGFTLLEILVIGIILILVAIGVIAFGALDQSGKVTKTTLANLRSMLADFDARTRLRDQPQRIWIGGTATNTNPAVDPPIDLWKTQVVLPSTGASVASGSTTRYDWGPVANTQIVLQYLSRMPENKQLMTKLPSKQIHGVAETNRGGKLMGPSGDTRIIDPPLVLDAWNNPIIFVGSDGLSGVRFDSQKSGAGTPTRRVTSTGVIADTPAVTAANRSKSWRPFFASAGPDGDFATGDDNVYSFEQ